MRVTSVLTTAVSTAVLAFVAAVVAATVGVNAVSVNRGLVVRVVLVSAVLAVVALVAWTRRRASDPPEQIVLGLLGGWLLNPASWNGRSFAGQLVIDEWVGALVVDLVLWAIVSFVLVLLLSRTSTPTRSTR